MFQFFKIQNESFTYWLGTYSIFINNSIDYFLFILSDYVRITLLRLRKKNMDVENVIYILISYIILIGTNVFYFGIGKIYVCSVCTYVFHCHLFILKSPELSFNKKK